MLIIVITVAVNIAVAWWIFSKQTMHPTIYRETVAFWRLVVTDYWFLVVMSTSTVTVICGVCMVLKHDGMDPSLACFWPSMGCHRDTPASLWGN